MRRILAYAGAAVAMITAYGSAQAVMVAEERLAQQEERAIIRSPIGGFYNRHWYNYRTNITEARKELSNDLKGAGDTEDLRDAWDEYRHELKFNRGRYVKEMAERGYRLPRRGAVSVE